MNIYPSERAASQLREGMSHADYKRIIDKEYARPSYLAVAKTEDRYAVREIYSGCSDLHVIGNLRDFDTFDEADQVAKELAAGRYPEIRSGGNYISNR